MGIVVQNVFRELRMSVKNNMTAEFLRSAFGGESMAHMRYLVWGAHAAQKGFPHIGRLYEAIAHAEYVHAKNHFTVLEDASGGFKVDSGGEFGLRGVADNLVGAIEGERGEIEQMYPVYKNAAELQNEKDAVRSFHYALEAEKIHVELFSQAREYALKGKDMPIGDDKVHICPVCGFTHVGTPPETCPVCRVKSNTFVGF